MNILESYVRELLRESYGMVGMSVADSLDYLTSLEGRNIIFFDTETLGFTPKHQITQIAAMVVPIVKWGEEPTVSAEFDQKTELTPESVGKLYRPESAPEPGKQRRKTYADLLKMTQYYEDEEASDPPEGLATEEQVLQDFRDFCASVSNPVYAAHNAKFDMRMVNDRAHQYGIPPLPKGPVLDTLQLINFFVRPVLESAREGTKMADVAKASGAGAKVSAKLGDLAQALDIDIDNWHNAQADVEMMFKVLGEVVVMLRQEDQFDLEAAEAAAQRAQAKYSVTKRGVRRREKGRKRAAKMGRETY